MSKNIPFIHKFKTDKNYYIYDVNTNNIIKVDEDIYNVCDTDKWYENRAIIKAAQNKLFSTSRPKNILPKCTYNEIVEQLENGMHMLTLFISDKCNLVCKYCCYSEVYEDMINLKDKFMSWEVAKKAIDFYYSHSDKTTKKSYAITFYGGEPFLNFNLMKKCIKYVENNFVDKFNNTMFTVSTNLTILNEKIMKFLIKYNIYPTVSLDGPKELHDRYRVFKNGTGSYDIVIENLEKLYKYNEKYFKQNVSYNVVAAPPIDYIKMHSFFTNEISVKADIARIGPISYIGGSHFGEIYNVNEREGVETEKEIFKIFKDDCIKRELCKDIFLSNMYYEIFNQVHNRKMSLLPDDIIEKGACIPGLARLLVDCEGNFYPCEKGGFYKIGNIYDGFNYQKIHDFVNNYSEIRKKLCLDCWAIRFCNSCYLGALKGDKLNIETKLKECERTPRIYNKILIRYTEIMEENPLAFKRLREWAENKPEYYPVL